MDFQSTKSFGKLRLRAFQPYHQYYICRHCWCKTRISNVFNAIYVDTVDTKHIHTFLPITFLILNGFSICKKFWKAEAQGFSTIPSVLYVSLRLRVQNAVPAQPCVGKYWISLILLNFLHCNFRLWFKTPQPFNSYPCHASEVTRNTLNHCLKFTVCSIFCHICYGKISEKNVNTFFKVKLFVSKASHSFFQGFDLFQMLLASHS